MVALLAIAASTASTSRAQGRCGRAGRPWVGVAFAGAEWTPELRDGVLADLRAGLSLQGFDACPVGTTGTRPPLAMIELSASDPDNVSVSIDVHDAITEKRLARDVDLSSVTQDSRSLSIAVAADELLRASWAELALADAPEPSVAPPPEVKATVRASLAPELAPEPAARSRLGARFAFEHHGGGLDLLGGDVHGAFGLGERVAIALSLGVRDGLSTDTGNGRVDARALAAAGEVQLALWPQPEPWLLFASAGVGVASLELEGETSSSTRRSSAGAGLAVQARAGIGTAIRLLGPLELQARAGLGVPLRSVEARDATRVVTSSSGLQLHGGVGLGVEL